MLQSMTGFGRAVGTFADKTITVEIKSLNSKQFDLSLRLPMSYREKESELRSMLADRLGRGKLELGVHVDSPEGERKAKLNQNIALNYIAQVRDLEDAAGMSAGADILPAILGMPDVWQVAVAELDEEEWAAVRGIVSEAADHLIEFRRDEGSRLADDVRQRIANIRELRQEVESQLPNRMQAIRDRIERNVREFASEENADQNRLEQEIVYYLEKLDITEEHVRLESHCGYFLETMETEAGEAGKKLGFITQELGREINTMGSKANYAPIQRAVVQMKDELEKVKEQLLNIR